MLKQVLVIAISLVTFVVPNFVGLGVWVLGDGLPTILHSLIAIMAWVVSFGISSLLFWRLVRVTSGTRVA